jgi:hypothetical protein
MPSSHVSLAEEDEAKGSRRICSEMECGEAQELVEKLVCAQNRWRHLAVTIA